ncbi:MAG: metallophosphoesterase [Acidimicrobiales bacterium]
MRLGTLAGLVAILLALSTVALPWAAADATDPIDTNPGLKVAVIGDTGIGAEATAVRQLISDEGADMVIHTGDFDYEHDPAAFESWIDSVLGSDFPYFVTVGNHDLQAWSTYQQNFEDRVARIPEASCSGDYGVNAVCSFRGLSFVLSGVGTAGTGHEQFLQSSLAGSDHRWRMCAWHKNQRAMQAGGKTDEVGWTAYETCREQGAIIVTGHEHSYSRTKTLIDMDDQIVDPLWPNPDDIRIAPGATIAVVSGAGGRPLRGQDRCLPATPPYGCNGEWASISTSSNGGDFGALFLEFNIDGDPTKGRGTFKEANGRVVDSFEMTAQTFAPPPSPPERLLYFSTYHRTLVDGIMRIANEDIAVVTDRGPRRYFDGSDVGLGQLRLDGFAHLENGDIVMSFTQPGVVPGIPGVVDDSDLVRFSPTLLGGRTEGTFSLHLDGSDVGLTTNGEDIDALEILEGGTIVVSTKGAFAAGGVRARDEDLVALTPTSLGSTSAGSWELFFDGSDLAIGAEDIDAAAMSDGTIAVSVRNAWTIAGRNTGDEDVIDFSVESLGPDTAGDFSNSLRYDGSRHDIERTDIGGFDLP